MGHVICTLVLAVAVPGIEPEGAPPAVRFGANRLAHALGEDGLVLRVAGPTRVLFTLHGPATLRDRRLDLELRRDDRFVSSNTVVLKRRDAGPAGYPLSAVLATEVAPGEHTYRLSSSAGASLWASTQVIDRIGKRPRAEKEVEVAATPAAVKPAPPPPGSVPAGAGRPVVAGEISRPPAAAETETATAATAAVAHATIAADALGTDVAEAPRSVAEPGAPLVASARRVAVYDLALESVAPALGNVVTDSVVGELRKLRGISVIGMSEIRDMLALEAAKDQLGCSDVTCLAEIGGALGADDLVSGRLATVGDSRVIVLRRIDQRRADVVNVFDQRLALGDGEELLAAVGPAVEKLYPEQPLRPGATRGVAEEVALRLHPPPLPRWSVYGAGGAALAALAGGGVFGWLTRSAQDDYDLYARPSGAVPVDGQRLAEMGATIQSRARTANALFITGGALALAAGVMAFFTDWQGYGDAPVGR